MGYKFPDVPSAVQRVLKAEGLNCTMWLQPADVSGVVETVHVEDAGGSESSIFRTDRLSVDVYAGSRDKAKALAERVKNILTSSSHDTADGLLDRITVEVVPTQQPYQSDTTSLFNALYRVESRPI